MAAAPSEASEDAADGLTSVSSSNKYSASLTPERLHMDFIRCRVCNRAIAHIWRTGDQLRRHCYEEGTDPRCDFSNLHSFGIEEMVHGICEDLPLTHQAMHDSEFDLVLHDNPEHPEFVSQAITRACKEWLHEEHGAEQIALYMYANLDAGKPTEIILHNLQHRYCHRACDPGYTRIRDRHDHDRKLRFKQEKESRERAEEM